jgi:hypothetical protein
MPRFFRPGHHMKPMGFKSGSDGPAVPTTGDMQENKGRVWFIQNLFSV